jgi:hypothetical protein
LSSFWGGGADLSQTSLQTRMPRNVLILKTNFCPTSFPLPRPEKPISALISSYRTRAAVLQNNRTPCAEQQQPNVQLYRTLIQFPKADRIGPPHLPFDFFGQRAFARSIKDGSTCLGAPATISSNPAMNPFLRKCLSRTSATSACQSALSPALT